jgi:hypothetical protein
MGLVKNENLKETLLLLEGERNSDLNLVSVIQFLVAVLTSIKFISNFVDLEINFHYFFSVLG